MNKPQPPHDADHRDRHQQLMDRILQRYDQLAAGLSDLETKLPEYDDEHMAPSKRRRRTPKPR